jgi:hypothetical protein
MNKLQMSVVAEREATGAHDVWPEYLCLTKSEDVGYVLFSGRHEAIAEASQFYNEETEDYNIPDEIDGIRVAGIEYEYVVGGELQYCDDSEAVKFTTIDDEAVIGWLHDSDWDRTISVALVQAEFAALVNPEFPPGPLPVRPGEQRRSGNKLLTVDRVERYRVLWKSEDGATGAYGFVKWRKLKLLRRLGLDFDIGSEKTKLGIDPDTLEPIEAVHYFVVATDGGGKKWRHTYRFASRFEVVGLVGNVVYRTNRRACQQAKWLMDELRASGLQSVDGLREWGDTE